MPILNYTTTIDYNKTLTEIQKCLVSHGATKIINDYDADGIPVSLTFCLTINGELCAFCLPSKWKGVLQLLNDHNKVPQRLKTKEQALRVAWRIIKDWVLAQTAIIDAGLAAPFEVFLPYAVLENGNTVYGELKEKGVKALMP